jgi:DNA repair protein RecN (Recombination protein N)
MLAHLSIQNFTLIDTLELEFKAGMTVLTGETGAGKSIIIDALSLALGARTDISIIKHGTERCAISASFHIAQLPAAQQWLIEHELDNEHDCLLRRVIGQDGRSRGSINGQTVPLQMLRELGHLLVSIHGQHEHQTLLKTDKQRSLLDAYGGHISLVKNLQTLYSRWRKTQEQLTSLQTQNTQKTARYELLTYQVKELEKLGLQAEELAALDTEQRQLAHADELLQTCQNTLNLISENDEINLLNLLNTAHNQLSHLQKLDNKLSTVADLLNNAIIQTEEADNELRHYLDKIELNPERLQFVEQRLTQIHEVARKHRVKPEELYALQQTLTTELQQLENSDIQLLQLQQELEQLTHEYQTVATELTQKRQQAAQQLSPLVEKHLHELGMPGGRLQIQFETLLKDSCHPAGLENIEFYVSANPGQPLQPLAKVASGGELSRISLAIHVLTTQNEATPTLIFDEVDVGIGGGTAEIVGRLLRTLGKSAQVLCVTHLPQVASQGHQHLQVSKMLDTQTTQTQIKLLDEAEKIQEIARMLGGVKITSQTLAHAKEMLEIQD